MCDLIFICWYDYIACDKLIILKNKWENLKYLFLYLKIAV